MEFEIFGAWLIIMVLMGSYSVWRKNPATLFFVGLMLLPFGYDLTFNGLNLVDGINTSTGAFTYNLISPANDLLLGIIALGSFPVAAAIMLFCIMVLFNQFTTRKPEATF